MLRDRYHEAHDLIVRAWTDTDTFAFNGRFNQQRYVNIWPRPMQTAASADLGARRRLGRDLAVVRRDGLRLLLSVLLRLQDRPGDDGRVLGRNGAARQGSQPVSRRLPAIRRRRRERGSTRWTCMREAAEYFYGNCLHIDPRFAAPPGYATEATQRMGLQSQVAKAASYANKFNTLAREMDAIVDNGYVIIGSPDEVAEQLREVATNLNVGNLMLLLQFGNMSKDLTRYNTRMFAEQVHAEAEAAVRRMGASLVAAPDGHRQARRRSRFPGRRVGARDDGHCHRCHAPASDGSARPGGAAVAARLPARDPHQCADHLAAVLRIGRTPRFVSSSAGRMSC